MISWPSLLLRVGWRSTFAEWTKREILTVTNTQWQIERFIGPWRRVWRYATENVSGFHQMISNRHVTPRAFLEIFTHAPGTLAFRHNRARVAFASAATEAEARLILRALRHRFPQCCADQQEGFKPSDALNPNPHQRFDLTSSGLRLNLPVRRSWKTRAMLVYNILFGLSWTALWTGITLTWPNSSEASFLWIGATLSVIGLAIISWSLRELLWQLRGMEVISVESSSVRLEGKHLALASVREFDGKHICALRYAPDHYQVTRPVPNRSGFIRQPGDFGTLAFDYGAGTYRFGQDLTLAEAQALLLQILDRFPQYARDDMIPTVS